MYQHHADSLKIMVEHFQQKEEAIALIFGGSVAKGMERPDSDLDGMVIISEEDYAKRAARGELSETITGKCTYEGGYFDMKYLTKAYIKAAAEHGSEPTRNAFLCAKVMFSSDPEIEEIVNRIGVFQEGESDDKMLSFFSDLSLNYYYFWKACKPEGYMRVHTADEILYSVYRMILQQNKVLFPSNRRLEQTVESVEQKPENIVALGRKFAENMSDENCDAFVNAFFGWNQYPFPESLEPVMTRYQADFETWWYKPRPLVNEW